MKKLLFKLFRFSGLPFLFRELVQKNKVSILLFHDISRATAAQTFECLAKKYNLLDLNDYITAHETGDFTKIPEKALIITFDDGHIRNHEILAVVQQKKIPVTIFLCAAIVGTKRHYWFKFKNKGVSVPDLKHLPNEERLAVLSAAGFQQEEEYGYAQALQKDQIQAMKPHVNLQAHTLFHPILPKCNDREAYEEIVKGKEVLEEEFGLEINTLAYPNGDYSDRDIELAKAAGYRCGITVDYGFNTPQTDIFRLKRLSVNDTKNLDELIVKASGVWSFFKTQNGRRQTFGYAE